MASQITGVSIVCPTVRSGTDQRKHQSSASLAFVPTQHKAASNAEMFPFDDVIMILGSVISSSRDAGCILEFHKLYTYITFEKQPMEYRGCRCEVRTLSMIMKYAKSTI